jgi:hypothetical protein
VRYLKSGQLRSLKKIQKSPTPEMSFVVLRIGCRKHSRFARDSLATGFDRTQIHLAAGYYAFHAGDAGPARSSRYHMGAAALKAAIESDRYLHRRYRFNVVGCFPTRSDARPVPMTGQGRSRRLAIPRPLWYGDSRLPLQRRGASVP